MSIHTAAGGIKAIWSPHTGIVDWARVARKYGEVFQDKGGNIHLDCELRDFRQTPDDKHPVQIDTNQGTINVRHPQTSFNTIYANLFLLQASYVLTCCGLQSDRVAELSGCPSEPKIVPFRGEYLLLSPEKSKLINGNIYPVPDPRFPFLGVHFTPRMNGEVCRILRTCLYSCGFMRLTF